MGAVGKLLLADLPLSSGVYEARGFLFFPSGLDGTSGGELLRLILTGLFDKAECLHVEAGKVRGAGEGISYVLGKEPLPEGRRLGAFGWSEEEESSFSRRSGVPVVRAEEEGF